MPDKSQPPNSSGLWSHFSPRALPSVLALVGVALFLLAAAPEPAEAGCKGASAGPRSITEATATKATVCLINKERGKRGLSKLKSHANVARAARSHTKRMQKTKCFAHQCPGEPVLEGRLARADYLPCGCSWGIGENIAWGKKNKASPRRIVEGWMDSPPHRANILERSFHHAGVGVEWGSPYKGRVPAGTYTLNLGYRKG